MVAIASDEERSYPLANEAAQQFEKVAKSWAAGEIFQSAYNIDTPIQCETYIQYMYQPQIDESKLTEEPKRELKLPFVVRWDLYIGVDPEAGFQAMKEKVCLEQGKDNFVEWPSRYPDNGNDYEFVSHCGANKAETEVFFTQGKNKWTLVRVSATNKDETLVQYADGAWQVVYEMGLCS